MIRQHPHLGYRIAVLALGFFWFWPSRLIGADEVLRPLFFIAKSDSRNEVHYAVAMDAHCRLAADPVRAYWLRRGDSAQPPRPLSFLEQTLVYGVRASRSQAHRVEFSLAADHTRPIVVETSLEQTGCQLNARVKILGEWAAPRFAYVEIIDGRPIIPDVKHVELHALSADGRALCERIKALRMTGNPCPKTTAISPSPRP
jgi:hypothetical protein